MKKKGTTQKLIPLAQLQSGKPKRIEHQGKHILLCRKNDTVYAVDDLCTHEDISLSLGVLCEHRLRCPLHGSEFDVRTGQVLNEPADVDLRCYATVVSEGWVYLE